MRSRNVTLLLQKDARELVASRAWWLLLAAAGLLTGHAFLSALDTYGEMSGANGGPAALREGLSPLDGIAVPTFSALWLVVVLMLPFVVIRVVAHERATGAWKLLVQGPHSLAQLLASKIAVLLGAWLLAATPALVALMLWRSAGNHLGTDETMGVLLGHALVAWLTIGIAAAAAAASASEASAAIVTLAFTIGTWALDFVGAARGGAVARVAAYTPASALRGFERGLVRIDVVVVLLVLGACGMCVAGVCLRLKSTPRQKARHLAVLGFVAAVMVLAATRIDVARDVSEDRRNSFSVREEAVLRSIRSPVTVEVNLAAEDPRLADLRRVLDKLERVLPSLEVRYVGGTGTGMFATPGTGYGETWYAVGARREMTHATAEPVVLDVLYHLARIIPPEPSSNGYPGYPLVARPRSARALFFVAWPLLTLAGMLLTRRREAARRGRQWYEP